MTNSTPVDKYVADTMAIVLQMEQRKLSQPVKGRKIRLSLFILSFGEKIDGRDFFSFSIRRRR